MSPLRNPTKDTWYNGNTFEKYKCFKDWGGGGGWYLGKEYNKNQATDKRLDENQQISKCRSTWLCLLIHIFSTR